ncbi:hypothetical protein BS50DRAFT_594230 [Corynespora cassiicola Philippines]|uniref:Uncharacterized protein n=1 Tax=Corynespora cassiicola Philippines TaxID=1448308 RepID=A0A2T2N2Y6_CORCC|nr:hypothetical protein BS50DRAFT_594230 [Corynespora cassiicola Philippines]
MPFVPGRGDIVVVRRILQLLGLPTELVLIVLDHARYWREVTHESSRYYPLIDENWSIEFSAAHPYKAIDLRNVWLPRGNEQGSLREIEFLIVSHDQGWTTENTKDTYNTSSWFEASIVRRHQGPRRTPHDSLFKAIDLHPFASVEEARHWYMLTQGWNMAPRPSKEMETQRLHCQEMTIVSWNQPMFQELVDSMEAPRALDRQHNNPPLIYSALKEAENMYKETDEGRHSWYLQGNLVGRFKSIFDGEMVKRYRVVWGSQANPRWEGDEGSGHGEGFVDALRSDDIIVVWARAKRRGWENHVFGVRVTMRLTI